MAKKSGVPTIRALCKELCKFLAVYIPIVKTLFPDETEVILLLELLKDTACALVTDLEPLLEPGD